MAQQTRWQVWWFLCADMHKLFVYRADMIVIEVDTFEIDIDDTESEQYNS